MSKRIFSFVLVMISLFFGGCGETKRLENDFENARERWCGAESLSFRAEVRSELYDSVFDCTLLCTRKGEETVVEILSPENLAGIKARLKDGETTLEYDGLILAVGDREKGEISPLSAMPIIMSSLTDGYVNLLWNEKEEGDPLAAAEIYIDENSSLRLWFQRENFTLLQGELVSGGRAVVKCKISDFTEE